MDAPPGITEATCETGEVWRCGPGQQLRLNGEGLAGARRVRFAGGIATRPTARSEHRLLVAVPSGARSGVVRVDVRGRAATTPEPIEVVQPTLPGPSTPVVSTSESMSGESVPVDGLGTSAEVFPIDGRHDLGQSRTNAFGGGRGHQGQDLFASCGTPLVAARAATVTNVAYESAAGNYVVLQGDLGESLVYMHLRDRALVAKGDAVVAGQRIGFAGVTGRATGCQLHFELWSAPGWYTGGSPTDPLPWLRQVDATHEADSKEAHGS